MRFRDLFGDASSSAPEIADACRDHSVYLAAISTYTRALDGAA
jgi:hypothetical protein